MSYENQVSRPTYEQLLKAVQSLNSKVALMARHYEDLFYNLDYDNFSPNLRMDMKKFLLTYKEVYPDGSTSESSISMTAEQIALAVSSEREYVTNLLGTDYYTREQMQSQLSIAASGIYSNVSATYETKSNAGTQYTSLQSSISQTATSILSTVSATYATHTSVTQVKQTADKIEWLVASGTNSSNFTLTSRVASLMASEINMTGYVTFNALSQAGQTTINGGNITTGYLSADRIRGGTITGITISGSTLTSANNAGQRVDINDGFVTLYNYNTPIGGLHRDSSNRAYLYSNYPYVLKLESGDDMSINARVGRTVYADGNWRIGSGGIVTLINQINFQYGAQVSFNGATVDFYGSSVSNLNVTAKWG